MRFVTSRETLRTACDTLARVVPRKHCMPVLLHARATLAGNKLTLAGTDLTMSLSYQAEVKGLEDGEALLPLRRLAELVKAAPDVVLEVEATPEGRVHLRRLNSFTGEASSSASLAGEELRNYPKLPEPAGPEFVSLPAKTVARALAKCLPFISRDELRPKITGLKVEVKPSSFRVVSTDGHRLAQFTAQLPAGAEFEFIMEGDCARAVQKLLGTKALTSEDFLSLRAGIGKESKAVESISILFGRWILTSKVVAGRYPNYADVIPDHSASGKVLTVGRAELSAVVDRAVRIANEISHQVAFDLNSRCSVSVEDIETGNEAREEFDANWTGEEFRVGLNACYLSDILRALGKETPAIEWLFDSPICASIVQPQEQEPGEELFYLLMPVRIDGDSPRCAAAEPETDTKDGEDLGPCYSLKCDNRAAYLLERVIIWPEGQSTSLNHAYCAECIPADAVALTDEDEDGNITLCRFYVVQVYQADESEIKTDEPEADTHRCHRLSDRLYEMLHKCRLERGLNIYEREVQWEPCSDPAGSVFLYLDDFGDPSRGYPYHYQDCGISEAEREFLRELAKEIAESKSSVMSSATTATPARSCPTERECAEAEALGADFCSSGKGETSIVFPAALLDQLREVTGNPELWVEWARNTPGDARCWQVHGRANSQSCLCFYVTAKGVVRQFRAAFLRNKKFGFFSVDMLRGMCGPEKKADAEPPCAGCGRSDSPTYLISFVDCRPAEFRCRECIPPDAMPVHDEDLDELTAPNLPQPSAAVPA